MTRLHVLVSRKRWGVIRPIRSCPLTVVKTGRQQLLETPWRHSRPCRPVKWYQVHAQSGLHIVRSSLRGYVIPQEGETITMERLDDLRTHRKEWYTTPALLVNAKQPRYVLPRCSINYSSLALSTLTPGLLLLFSPNLLYLIRPLSRSSTPPYYTYSFSSITAIIATSAAVISTALKLK